MHIVLRWTLLATAISCVTACARYKPMYDQDKLQPGRAAPLPAEKPAYSVYFTGSAGGAEVLSEEPALQLAGSVLAKADTNSAFLFLGDNLNRGMPKKDAGEKRAKAERQLDLQLDLVDGYKGTPVWLHGDRDWATYGMDGVERQEDYLEKPFDDNVMLPKNGCGDPELLELTPDVSVLIINSQWFTSDWTKFRELNEGCDAQSRKYFRWQLSNIVKDVAFDHVIVATHHPIITRGPRGGEHGFVGFFRDGFGGPISNFWRSKIGTAQDLYAPRMLELRNLLENVFDEHTTVTFVSGHEHLLQAGTYEGHPVIGSGTAHHRAPGKVGQGTEFTAGVPGLAAVHYYDNGEAWVEITQADGSPSGKTLYTKKLYRRYEEEYKGDFAVYESSLDSFAYAPFEGYREFGKMYKWAFGENNKELFTTKYTYPILRLDEHLGGLKISQRGGGGQTNSLRLVDSLGRDYALRSVRKDPERLLPASFRVGPLITLTQDVFFTANPFGAITAAAIAEGIDFPHANPRMYYLPAQPSLGELNAAFANDLYILEERPVDEWIGPDGPFGEPRKIDGRDDVQSKIREGYKDRIDQEQLVRGRLLDVLLGDFDRHDDQWRYAEYKDTVTGVSSWRVIPRDRDQAILNIDGKLLRLAGVTLPAVREVQDFGPRQKYPGDFTFQARFLDRRFLNELTREQWLAAAQELKAALTDAEIERAFDEWPGPVRAKYKAEYVAAFKQRRDELPRYATEIYEFHAEHVYVIGSDAKDRFEVTRNPNGSVQVDVWQMKKGEKVYRTYSRLLNPDETDDVQLFGLRDEDEFVVTGESKGRSIKVRIVPGPEDDEIITDDKTRALRKRTRVYAWPGEDEFDINSGTEVHSTRNQAFNNYDYRDVDYDYGLLLPAIGFNPDDGLKLGLNYQHHHYTFHRHFVQTVNATFATASLGARFDYGLRVENVAPNMDVGLALAYQTPSFAINYFGLGNETVQPLSGDNSQFRVRQELIGFYPNIVLKHKKHTGGFTFSLLGESIKLERDLDRILGRERSSEGDIEIFERHNYAGAAVGYDFLNVDKASFPRDGLAVDWQVTYRRRFTPVEANNVIASGSVAIYQHLWKEAMFGLRLGGGTTQGDYYFYQGQLLGRSNLRGYRRERFIGDNMAFVNVDYRQMIGKVFHSRFGAYLSYDLGRVWNDEFQSDKWHYNYGGGVILRPLGLAVFTVGYHIPEDGSPPQVKVAAGFDF